MKKLLSLLVVSCGTLFLGGCVYDEGGYSSVSVSRGGSYRSDDGPSYVEYDDDRPYYAYSGRRYYRSGDRYVHYVDRRPVYVNVLPGHANYVTPKHRYRNEGAEYRHREDSSAQRYRAEPVRRDDGDDLRNRQREWQQQQVQKRNDDAQQIRSYQAGVASNRQEASWKLRQQQDQWRAQQAQAKTSKAQPQEGKTKAKKKKKDDDDDN